MNLATNQALRAYSQINVETSVNAANPVQLIVLLYDGALGAIASAKGDIQEQRYADKSRRIGMASNIIEELRAILDFEKGGEIAANLHDLYLYMKQRLAVAGARNDLTALEEVYRLLSELREAWASVAQPGRAQPAAGYQDAQPYAEKSYGKA